MGAIQSALFFASIDLRFLRWSWQMGYRAFEAAEIAGRPYPSSKNAMAVMYSTYSALFGSTSVVFAKVAIDRLVVVLSELAE